MKETAVGFLMRRLQEEFPEQMYNIYVSNQLLAEDICIKSNSIEKKNIMKTAIEMHEKGFDDCVESMNKGISFSHKEEAKRYYNETFGKDEKAN